MNPRARDESNAWTQARKDQGFQTVTILEVKMEDINPDDGLEENLKKVCMSNVYLTNITKDLLDALESALTLIPMGPYLRSEEREAQLDKIIETAKRARAV
jgi:hypothetical protein